MEELKFAFGTLRLPSDWMATSEPDCVTLLARSNSRGALQISTVTKELGDITESDLREFALERVGEEVLLQNIQTRHLRGISAGYCRDGVFWQEWWLAAKSLMIYVTYNVEQPFKGLEDETVQEIVNSITPRNGGTEQS